MSVYRVIRDDFVIGRNESWSVRSVDVLSLD